MAAGKNVKIRMFDRQHIIFHWLFVVPWLVLALTGALFYWRSSPYADVAGIGPYLHGSVGQWLRTVHRLAALVFLASPLVWFLMGPRKALAELREMVPIREDLRFMAVVALHYTFGKPALPPQGKYNGGHKLNFLVVLLTYVGFAVSGITMWFFRGAVGVETFRLMLLIHSVSFWVGLLMALLHMYLTLFHPFTRRSLGAMVSGYVDLSYAQAEHPLWVKREVESGRAELVESPARGG